MSCTYPHTRLFINHSKTVVISGPHIQIIDSSTGEIINSTTHDLSVLNSGPIRCVAMDSAFKYIAEVGEDKLLKLWEVEGLKLLSSRELPKKPTGVVFTGDSKTILVSDKFGDVFSYPFEYVPLTKAQKKDALSSHENPSGGTLILGHASSLNAFLLTPPEKEDYIITADRDEHIRVSWYPQGYNIETYCLGHLKFVSALHISPSQPLTLVSGGGDPVLKIWTWITGDEVRDIPIWDEVEPFIVVKMSRKPEYGDGGEDGGDGEGEEEKGARAKRKKGKGKGKKKELREEVEAAAQREEDDQEGSQSVHGEKPEPQKVLAVRKIESVSKNDGDIHIIFSAIGATALFSVSFSSSMPTISHIDLGKPVIDFIVSENGLIWVLIDVEWSNGDISEGGERIKIVEVSTSGELSEISPEIRAPYSALLSTLNQHAVIPASPSDMKTLDLYAELASLPKFVTPIPNSNFDYDVNPENTLDEPVGPSSKPMHAVSSSGLTKREVGRLKRTKKVEEVKQNARVGLVGTSEKKDESDEIEEPASKRAKSETEGDGDGDTIMALWQS